MLERAAASGVVLLGHRDDVDLLLGGFDLFVLASHREGQPRAAMEAAATGLPIVATNVRGCRQVVDDGTTGLLVPVADVGALRAAIGALAASPDRRRAMGAAGRAKAEREFDEREVVRRVMDAYAWAARAARHQARVSFRIHSTVAASPSSSGTGTMSGNSARRRALSACESRTSPTLDGRCCAFERVTDRPLRGGR